MSLAMNVIGPEGIGTLIAGIVVGIIGIVLMSINYPVYKKLLESRKQKYAYEIKELAKEIIEK